MASRITIDEDVMGGVPCVRGLRIPVRTVVRLAASMTDAEILEVFPDLTAECARAIAEAAAEGYR